MIQTQISLTEEQHLALKFLAAEKNSSMSEQIRIAVNAYLQGGGKVCKKKED